MTALARSPGSTRVVNVSAPMSRTRLAAPDRIRASACASPYTKPEHTAARSNAGTVPRPRRAATSGAVAGHRWSGVDVATITMSTESTPAFSRARRPAATARSLVEVPGSTWCRAPIPVRDRIHSSVVSSVAARSSFVTTRRGRAPPRPCSTVRVVVAAWGSRSGVASTTISSRAVMRHRPRARRSTTRAHRCRRSRRCRRGARSGHPARACVRGPAGHARRSAPRGAATPGP